MTHEIDRTPKDEPVFVLRALDDDSPICPDCGGETYSSGTRCDVCLEEEIEQDDDDRLCEQHAILDCGVCPQ